MTLVNTGWFLPYQPLMAFVATVSLTIDAADEVAGFVLPVKAGNIRYIHWRTGTVTTGGADNLDLRIETITLATGNPSGTLWGANTNASIDLQDADDNTWFRTQLTADATVTAGDNIAVLLVNPAANFATANINCGCPSLHATTTSLLGLPYGVGPLRSNLLSRVPGFLIEYDDGTFNPVLGYCPYTRGSVTLDTGTNPDEAALYFIPDAPMRIVGWGVAMSVAAGGDFRMALYQSGNDTPLATSATQDGDSKSGTGAIAYQGMFTASTVLAAGTAYRLALLPLTTNDLVLQAFVVSTAASKVALNLAQMQLSTRNRSGTSDPDAAAWTEADDLPCIWMYADQMDDGSGGGGGMIRHPGMSGGVNA